MRTRAIIAGLRDRLTDVRARVEATARNGQALAGLLTTWDGLREKFSTTLARLRDAELAEGVERALAPVRFDLVEGAALPTRAGTNRPLMAAAALVVALALALGVGFALDARDRSIRDAETLRRYVPTAPVLAAVPRSDFTHVPGPKAEA
jgi:uncharacterized protein involved in exopolysaccharide biosynthesis